MKENQVQPFGYRPAGDAAAGKRANASRGLDFFLKTRPMRTTNETTQFFTPGDNVRLVKIDESHPAYRCSCYRIDGFSTHRIENKIVYRVRSASLDRLTGKQRIRLVGITGCKGDDGQEIGLPACDFEYLGTSPVMPFEPVGERFDFAVPHWVHAALDGLPVSEIIEEFCIVRESGLETVLRRWKSNHRLSQSIGDMSARLAGEVKNGKSFGFSCILSPLAVADLEAIAARLRIDPRDWLLGVIGNVAHRFELFRLEYERGKRRKPTRKNR